VKSKGEMDEHWATVLDEAWEELANNPPSIIKVVLADGPGDSQQRKSISPPFIISRMLMHV
jgi:hypothetical protein